MHNTFTITTHMHKYVHTLFLAVQVYYVTKIAYYVCFCYARLYMLLQSHYPTIPLGTCKKGH